jgi:tetratricopeptide (TPR) repeat protein
MTDYTRHLGEIVGQTPEEHQAAMAAAQRAAERAADQAAKQAAAAQHAAETGAMPAGQGAADTLGTGPAPIDVVAGHAADHGAAVAHAAAQAAAGPDLSSYAFPFQAHEVFGILPSSIGGRMEGLWQVAHNFTGQTSSLSMAITGLVVCAIAIAIVSTVRVWRRGQEYPVAGFGDRLARVGTRYIVRQEQPARSPGSWRAPRTVSAEAKKAVAPVAVAALAKPQSTDDISGRLKAADAAREAPVPAPSPSQATAEPVSARRAPTKTGLARAKPEPAVTTTRAPLRTSLRTSLSSKPDEAAPAAGSPAPKAAPMIATKASPPAAEPAKAKQPKTVRRQLFKRQMTNHTFSGRLQGAYGAYEARDRLFAADYLRQTNEAFEATHLKGKGPSFAELRLTDSHRAERLFMMAARVAAEDPPTAIAALWQAVEEDSGDAVAWLRLAHCYLGLGDVGRAGQILEPLQAQAEKSGLHMIVAAAANSRSKISAQKGDAEQARKLLTAGLTAAEASDNPFLIGISAANLGTIEAARGKLDSAKHHLARGVKSLDACEERLAAARTRLALGTVLLAQGDGVAAEKTWTEAADTLHQAKSTEEAALVERWLKGEGTPSRITL